MDNFGIYKIECRTTGVIYIGSTSVSFKNRWRKHKQRLRHHYHENSYLQNAWNKYGEEDFVFEIVESINNVNIVKERESYWLSFKNIPYCLNKGKGYKIILINKELNRMKKINKVEHSIEQSKKISENLKHYYDLTKEKLANIILDIVKKDTKIKENRAFVIGTDKKGYIDFTITLLRKIGVKEEKLIKKRKEMEKKLPDGYYRMES